MSLKLKDTRFEPLQHLLLQPVFENVLTAMMFADGEGNLVEANDAACTMLGYPKSELLQLNRNNIIVRDVLSDKVAQENTKMGNSSGIINFRRKNGNVFKAKASLSIVCGSAGDSYTCIAVVDISVEENLQTLLNEVSEMAAVGGYKMDLKTNRIEWTSIARQIHAAALDYEPVLENVLQFFKEGTHRNRLVQLIEELKHSHTGWDEEFLSITEGGNEKWLRVMGMPETVDGELVAIKGFIQDIHKKKILESALVEQGAKTEAGIRFNENRFRLIIENLNVGIVKHTPTTEIIICNKAALSMLGLTKDQLLGLTSYDPRWNVIHEDGTDFPAAAHPVSVAIATQKAVSNVVMGVFRPVTNDRVWLLVNAKPQFFDDGTMECITVTFADITEKKKIEAQLSSQLERYRMLMQTSQDAIHILDGGGKLLEWNSAFAKHLGYREEEIADLHVWNWDILYDKNKTIQKIQSVEGEGISFETKHQLKNGAIKEVEIKLHKFGSNGMDFFYASARDISELKQKQQEVEKLNEELREFSVHLQQMIEKERADLAKKIHDEFSQKFVAINMNAELVKRKLGDENETVKKLMSEQIGMVHDVIRSSRTLFNLLYPTMLEDLGLADTIRACCEEHLQASGIRLVLDAQIVNEKLSRETSLALFRIFQESLNNVLQYANATEVHTSIYIENDSVVMKIDDNGIGFDSTIVNTKEQHGLLIMRERAYAMKGKFEINALPGKGTVVMVRLPFP